MAGLLGRVTGGGSFTTGVAKKAALQIRAPSTQKVGVPWVQLTFAGTDPSGPQVHVEVERGAGTDGTSTAATVQNQNPNDANVPNTTARVNYSANPTAGTKIEEGDAHPQGFYLFRPPGGHDIEPGDTLTFYVTVSTAVNVSVSAITDE